MFVRGLCLHALNRALQRGFVKRRVGRPEEAIEDLKRASSLDAKSREAYNHLGMALLDAGNFEQVCPRMFPAKCITCELNARGHCRPSMLFKARPNFLTLRSLPI